MKLLILSILSILPSSCVAQKHTLVKPNVHNFSKELIYGVKHFENNKLLTGKIKKDKIRVDKLAKSNCAEVGYGFTSNLIEEAVRYGYLKKGYSLPKTMTQKEAHDFLLKIGLPTFRAVVNKVLKVEISEYEKEALIMFAYNNGSGAVRKLICKSGRLNDGNKKETLRVLNLYVYAGKNKNKKINGLIRRRKYETRLFNRMSGRMLVLND